MTLGDLGEFALLRQIVIPAVSRSDTVSPLGDDCAFVRLPSGEDDLVVTSDAAPRPLAWHVGHQSYRTWGWYAVVVAVSDLAAGGAIPLVITTSVEAPRSMTVTDLREFFEGMAEASHAHNIANAGGNIREAKGFASHGTAIGLVRRASGLRRNGARPGDQLIAVGRCGLFASAFLRAKNLGLDALSPEEQQCLVRPRARAEELRTLSGRSVLTAASDASDGVLGAVWNIAEASGCAAELDLSPEAIPPYVLAVASEFHYDPWNLMFFWGDWQVIVSVPLEHLDEFRGVANERQIPTQFLGVVREGPPRLLGTRDATTKTLRLLRNESFVRPSFNGDVMSHVESMLRTELWA
jgi:thiamine-monophosphate kinase